MARPKKQAAQQRESPIQFRPGSELGHLVRNFATGHGLSTPEACRLLLSLAVAEMDCRFAGLILPLAGVMGGENAYVRACEHVHTAVQAARRRSKEPVQLDPDRAEFIEETVKVALTERGAADKFRPLDFLHGAAGAESACQPAPGVPHETTAAGTQTRTFTERKRMIRHFNDDEEPGEAEQPRVRP